MNEGRPEHPGTDPAGGCIDLATLDRLAADPEFELGPAVSVHLESCERCRGRLSEMRRAERFLERFRTDAEEEPSFAPQDQQSVRIPGYRVLGLIAFGGQGAVYRALQEGTERIVAIKAPIGNALRRPSTRYRFEREIELTARLDHPGIVRVLGACELHDGRLGCVMEFVSGVPFDRWAATAREDGGPRRVVGAVEAIADAIAYAHQRAVIHRDIKPSNVIVTDHGVPRVLDFGLAKAIGESESSFATLTGAFLGTLVYSAPEQISGGADAIDLRTDVYALGLLLFQALTGSLPYDADVPPARLVHQIRDLSPARPSELAPGVGDELDAVVTKALSKEPDRRYQTVAEFRDDLRAWLDGRAVRAKNDSRWYVLRKAAWRHRRVVALAAIVLASLVAVVAAGLVTRGQFARAALADAVRDARTLESHWVRTAELRSIGLDNFEAGEFGAWDALLEPDRILVQNGIEGPADDGSTPGGPAYWALWEIYLNTPVVFGVPTLERTLCADASSSDVIAVVSNTSHELQWWDRHLGIVTRSIPLPSSSDAVAFEFAPDARAASLTFANGDSHVLATESGSFTRFDEGVLTQSSRISNDRVLTGVRTDSDTTELRLWDTGTRPPSLVAGVPIPDRIESTALDASGAFGAAITVGGELFVLDLRTGGLLHHRSKDVQPRFLSVHSRGKPGEFLLFGVSSAASLDMRDRELRFLPLHDNETFSNNPRQIAWAGGGDRTVTVSNRHRLWIGSRSRSIRERVLPALSASTIRLSSDGAIAFGLARPSGRPIAFETEPSAVQRLPFPADVTHSGFATVPCILFSSDSASLLAAGMNGSVRCYRTPGGAELWRTERELDNGITMMRALGDDIIVGTHDLGQRNATIARVRNGAVRRLHAEDDRWFSGLEADPDGRIWGLTGMGRLIRIDAEDGSVKHDAILQRHPNNPTFRALARFERHGLLIAGPAESGIVLLDEDTLETVGMVTMPPIREIAVSPGDPDLFATAGDDGSVRLFRLRPGSSPAAEPVGEFGAHAGPIFCLAFTPDGKQIASGGGSPERRDVRIWDVRHGRELAALDLFELGVFGLAFSPDGRWLAASGEIHPDHPERGGQLFLIDLHAPDRCIAGNLEYHIARFVKAHGREPEQAGPIREWAARVGRP